MRTKPCLVIVGILMLWLPACNRAPQFGQVDADRLLRADDEPEQWMTPGRNVGEHHHSPLAQINTENVDELGLAWEYDARSRRGQTPRGLEATPVVVDGVMYTSGAWSVVYALDAKTGEELWRYDPDVNGSYARLACCDVVNRGVEVRNGRVYVGTLDGYLVALDAGTGEEVWTVDTITDRTRSYTITGAPQIAGDKVVVGNSGGEFGVRGYITAYDAESGDFAWRFFTVPGDPAGGFEHPEMEMAAQTWDPNSNWKAGGGGTVWGEMAYDPELNLLYVGTGNSSPYPQKLRSPDGGDNLFLVSILAINPDTGRLVWHYQTTPGEQWDYPATQHMILADLSINGEPRKVLMQAPKNGFFYVLDRETGEFLSAEPFVTVNWARHIDPETGRPVLTGQGDYSSEPKLVFPGMPGGHNWQPMAYSPSTGLVYVPAIDLPMLYRAHETFTYRPGTMNRGADGFLPPVPDDLKKYVGEPSEPTELGERLLAWDPIAQRDVWSVPLKSFMNGGALSTDGTLVFQGTATGQFVAYHAETGEKLKSIHVGTGIMAGPMTYSVDGAQYVAVMAGYGGALLSSYPEGSAARTYENYGRILAFKLGGGSTPLPPKRDLPTDIPAPPQLDASREEIRSGQNLYAEYCVRCHGSVERDHGSGFPNLAFLTRDQHEAFEAIVLEGTMSYGGMASYADVLTEEEVEAIQAFVASRQRALRPEE